MYATTAREIHATVNLTERQIARVRLTGSNDSTIVVNLSAVTAGAARFDEAESVVYERDEASDGLVGYGTAEFVDGRSHANAARVLPAGGQSNATAVGIPKAAFEQAFDVTLAELQEGADVRLVVSTGPGVIHLRRPQAIDVDVDPETFADLDAQLLLEESDT